MSTPFPVVTVTKGPSESPTYLCDFTVFPEMYGGTLGSPTKSAPVGITVSDPVVTTARDQNVDTGKGLWVRISGGTANNDYTVSVFGTITDANGNTSVREYRVVVQVR